MKLTQVQKDKALETLNKHGMPTCIICQSQNFVLNDTLFELREFDFGSLVAGTQSTIFPVVPLTCKTCGHSHLFNAVLMGLLDNKGDK